MLRRFAMLGVTASLVALAVTFAGGCSFLSVPPPPASPQSAATPTRAASTATTRPVLPTPPAPTATPLPPTNTPVPPPPTPTIVRTEARVIRVLSGDTVEVLRGSTRAIVQYLGVQAPAATGVAESLGAEALRRNRQLVEGKMVVLERDVTEANSLGQLARYVWVGDQMVNATLLREGYALFVASPEDRRYAGLFAFLEDEARGKGAGMWAKADQAGQPAAIRPADATPTASARPSASATPVTSPSAGASATPVAGTTPTASPTAMASATPVGGTSPTPPLPIFAVAGLHYSLSPERARLVVDFERLVPELPAQFKIDHQGRTVRIFVARTVGTADPVAPNDTIVKEISINPAGADGIEIRIDLVVSTTWFYSFDHGPDRLVFDLKPQ